MRGFLYCIFFTPFISSLAYGATLEEAGRLYLAGKSEESLRVYAEVWAQEHAVDSALNAALISAEMGKPEAAVSYLEEALRVFPDNPQVLSELSWAFINAGEYGKAEALLGPAGKIVQPDLRSLIGRGRLALGLGDFDSAIRFFNRIIKRDPASTLAHYYLGKAYEGKGDPESAIKEYQQVLKEDSHFVEARLFLAKLFEDKENPDEAWKQYARLSTADNRNISVKEGMKRLAGLITKKPEELVPPRVIVDHTPVPRVDGREKLPVIKVGIGTTSGGAPSLKKSLIFRTSTAFTVWDPDTRKDLRTGSAKESWTIRLNPGNASAEIVNPGGRVEGRFRSSIFIRQKGPEATSTIINSLEYAPNTSWGGLADKEIRGDIEIRVDRKRKSLVVINHISIEEYLYGVLAAEMPSHWPMEALKAQAVIARTQAVYRKNFHRKSGYDVCDEQHCQVYTGIGVESEKARAAVDGTKGQYLAYNGRAAHTVFSSNCGGVTQTGSQAGWGNVAYWISMFDGQKDSDKPRSLSELRKWLWEIPPAFCESSKYTWRPEYRWSRVVMAGDIARKIRRKKDLGRLKAVKILERNGSGRVAKILLEGANGNLILKKEHEIRKYLGVGSLRSTLFVLDPVYQNGTIECLIIEGGGWGHGVGFCQSGAAGRAETGQSYKDILKAYFPDLAVQFM